MNKALVQGQRIMNLAGEDKSIESFTSSFVKQYGLNEQAAKQEKIKVGKWADQVGIPSNILKVEPGDRDTVLEWNQGMRDDFVDAMKKYDESGDDKDKRVADEILVKVKNLNNQLGLFQADKQQYLKDYDAGMLMPGRFDASFYANNYTKNKESAFKINQDGNLYFGEGADEKLFNDVAGEYKIQNKNAMLALDDISIRAINQATQDSRSQSGTKNFNFITTKKLIESKVGDAQEVISLSQMDLNEFDEKDITFANEYVNKTLPPEMYEMAKQAGLDENDPKWMDNPENSKVLTNMISTYLASGVEKTYENQYQQEFDIEAERGFLSAAKGSVYSSTLRSRFTPNESKELYNLLESGKTAGGKTSVNIAGYDITSNKNGTFTVVSGDVVSQEDIDNSQSKYFKKNTMLGKTKVDVYNNALGIIDLFGIKDSDYRKITNGKNEPEPEEKKKKKSKLPTKPKGIDRNYFKGPMTSKRVLEIEKLYPGLKMVKTNPNSINSTKYTLTFNGQNPQEIDTKRVDTFIFDGPSKSKNEFDNYINKYIK